MKIEILLDTDIGTDVDDAVALAYLLSQPDCDLLGITTVTGEPEKRASLASVLCKAAGRDIPIYPGIARPLQIPQRQMIAQQAAALPNWPHETQFLQGAATGFLRDTIHARPGEVILLAIGPLTNVARLFTEDPESASLLKGLVLMGGIFTENYPDPEKIEWNLMLDPQAADIVYRTPVQLHRSIGLDVTEKVVLPAAEVRKQFNTPLLRPVLDFAKIWFKQGASAITFHDPLAAATIFDHTLCNYQMGVARVSLDDKPGKVIFQPGSLGAPHQVATSVDVQRYLKHFFQVVSGFSNLPQHVSYTGEWS